jgi:chromosome segregation ATPase
MALMNEVERKRLIDTLRQDEDFRTDVRRELLTQDLLALPQTVALLSVAVDGLIEHQAEMQRDLTAMRGDLTAMRGEQVETRGDVAALVETTRQVLLVTQNLAVEVRQGFTGVEARFDQVDERFSQVEARFDQVDERFSQVEARFDQVDERFSQVDARFTAMRARFDQIEAEIRDLKEPPPS